MAQQPSNFIHHVPCTQPFFRRHYHIRSTLFPCKFIPHYHRANIRHPTFPSWSTDFPRTLARYPTSLCSVMITAPSHSILYPFYIETLFSRFSSASRCFRSSVFGLLVFFSSSSDTPRKAETWFGEDTLRSITRFFSLSFPSTFGHS